MQQNPITPYLRVAGLGIGAILFILMIYRSSQMANNPIYVKGKPYLLGQTQTAGVPYGQLASDGSLQAVTTAQMVTQPAPSQPVTSQPEATDPTPPATVVTPSQASSNPPVTTAESSHAVDTGTASHGKTPRVQKHED